MEGGSSTPHYYCHNCARDVEVNQQDFTCTVCHSGFVEEVSASNRGRTDNALLRLGSEVSSTLSNFYQNQLPLFQALIDEILPGVQGFQVSESASNSEPEDEDLDDEALNVGTRRSRRHANGRRTIVRRGLSFLPNEVNSARVIPAQLLPFFHGDDELHAHIQPAIYENILAILSNQLQTGPPGASREVIQQLPKIKLTEEQVSQYKNCSICFEDFQESEEITLLPCQHAYHTTCVTTWLQQRATCPVCRKDLNGHDTSFMEDPINPQSNPNPSSSNL